MHRAVIEYDRTVHRVEAELLLLNIARARHYRPVHFTAVSSVAATFDFRVKAGALGRISRGTLSDDSLVDLNYGTEVAENPTVTIIPVSGEEFTKRILRPLDESHLNFLVWQGFDLSMVLRLLSRGILIDGEEASGIVFNTPSRREEYMEFRRRLLHLAALEQAPILDQTWEKAARLGHQIARKGQSVPLPDLLAATALLQGLPLWSVDSDFKRIVTVAPLDLDLFGVD
jgi:predicted nucleic acid-binding protein